MLNAKVDLQPTSCTALYIQVDPEQSVFTDVETMVSQASDVFTNQGLDLGSVVVEVDQSHNAEEQRYMTNGCSCKLASGHPCHATFTPTQYRAMRDEFRELTYDQLDLIIKGQLRVLAQHDDTTQKSKARNTDCIRSSTQFRIGGHRVCRDILFCAHN